jgi:AcrR family transcriptional regulator
MTPYPARVDRETIVRTARAMLEADGLERLSLNKLAKALDIKAPSLYHHVQNKSDLLHAVNLLTVRDMVDEMTAAVSQANGDGYARLRALARAYRAYALAHPVAYKQLYIDLQDEPAVTEAILPLQTALSTLAGPEGGALRGLWALMHGFVTLELAGYFQHGEAIHESWERALNTYFAGWPQEE